LRVLQKLNELISEEGWRSWLRDSSGRLEALLGRRAWPIRLHLVLFAIALLTPILVFSSLLAHQFISSERRSNEHQVLSIARAIAAGADREIAGMISTLKALANSPSLQSGDLAAFYAQAQIALAPTSRTAVLFDMSGQQLVNTRLPWGAPLPVTQRLGSAFPRIVAQSRQPTVSDLFVGTVSKRLMLSVSVPVFHGNDVAYVLAMSFEPEQFLVIFKQAQLPRRWLAGISDRHDRIIVRSEMHEQFAGKPLHADARRKTGLREGVIEATDSQGVASLEAYHWSEVSGWRFAVWVPVDVLEAPLRRFQWGLASLGTAALGLALLLALFFGRRLSLPIMAAAEAGRLLGQGRPPRPLASPLSEANEVVDALRSTSVEIRQRTRELRNSETRLKLAQTVAGLATFDWNLRTGQILCSDNFKSLFGLPESAPIGPESLLATVHPEDREQVRADIASVRQSGGTYDVEFRVLTPDHQLRWIAGTGEALLDLENVPQRIIGASYDITEFKRAAETNAQLAAVVQSSTDAVMSMTPDGIIRTWNPGAEALFGFRAEEILGRSDFTLYPADAKDEYDEDCELLRRGKSLRKDVLRRRKDGELLNVNVNVAPMYTEQGRLAGFSAIVRDISDRKKHEEHLRFVMRELSHRSKNLLAVIQAMARQTARSSSDLEDFEKNYSQRLQALSASHDLLVHQNWHGAPLSELLRLLLTPFVDDLSERVSLSGPSLFVSPTAAQNLGLSVHELATNASKYGALSVPRGRVSIAWDLISKEAPEDRLRLSWKESGGPPVREPRRQGFGHIVMRRMVAQALDADVQLDFPPDGVTWTLEMPSTYVVK
jgi:PAS domain S-box-containing protein